MRRLGGRRPPWLNFSTTVPSVIDGEVASNSSASRKAWPLRSARHQGHRPSTLRSKNFSGKIEPAAGLAPDSNAGGHVCLVSIVRVPYTEGRGFEGMPAIALDNRGPRPDRRAFRDHGKVSTRSATSSRVHARPQGRDEGVASLPENCGRSRPRELLRSFLGSCIHARKCPAVGKTEEELKEAGVAFNRGQISFHITAQRPFQVQSDHDGFCEVLAMRDLPGARRAYCGARSLVNDPRGRDFDGNSPVLAEDPRRTLPCPPDPFGSRQGSRTCGRQARDIHN